MSGVVALSDRVIVAVDVNHAPAAAWDVPCASREQGGARWDAVDVDALAAILEEADQIACSGVVVVDGGGLGFVPGEVFQAIAVAGLDVELVDNNDGLAAVLVERSRPLDDQLATRICYLPRVDVDGSWTRASAIAWGWLAERRARAIKALQAFSPGNSTD